MFVRLMPEEDPAIGQIGDDLRIRLLDELAGAERELLGKTPIQPNRLHERQSDFLPELVVVLAKGGRDMNQSGPVLQIDESSGVDAIRRVVVRQPVRWLVAQSDEIGARDLPQHRRIDPQCLTDEILGEDHSLLPRLHLDVRRFGRDRQRDVAGKCPRRGRPCQEARRLRRLERNRGPFVGDDPHSNEHRWIGDFAIPLRDFMRRESGPAARAIRKRLVSLIEKSPVEHRLEFPPDRLDVVVGVRYVGVLEIDPEPHSFDHAFPLGLVLPDRFLALLDEFLDAVRLDLRLAVDANQLLDLELDRQAVSVPATLPGHVVPAHRLVSREEILVDAGHQMPEMRHPVRRGWAFVEDVGRSAARLLETLLERPLVGPSLQDGLFPRRRVPLQLLVPLHALSYWFQNARPSH